MGGFNLKEAFPDLNPRFHHFRLDPLDAGRVWFTSQASGTDKGSGFLGNQPTGKSFSTPCRRSGRPNLIIGSSFSPAPAKLS